MRLIDADELKTKVLKEGTSYILTVIDNAPTVELTETEIQEVLNKRCMTAVANEYLISLHGKRPQGDNKEALFVLNHLFYDCDNMTQKEYDILLEAIKEEGNV